MGGRLVCLPNYYHSNYIGTRLYDVDVHSTVNLGAESHPQAEVGAEGNVIAAVQLYHILTKSMLI